MLTAQGSAIAGLPGNKTSVTGTNVTGEIEQRLIRAENSTLSYGAGISLQFPRGFESMHTLCDEIALYARYLQHRPLTALWLLNVAKDPDSLLAITEISYQIPARLNRIISDNVIFGIELSHDRLEPASLSLLKGLGVNSLLVNLEGISNKLPTLPPDLLTRFQHLFFRLDPKWLAADSPCGLTEIAGYNPEGIITAPAQDPALLAACNAHLQEIGFTHLQNPLFLPRKAPGNCLTAFAKPFIEDPPVVPTQWLGIGLGAMGFIDTCYINTQSPKVYEEALSRLQLPVETLF